MRRLLLTGCILVFFLTCTDEYKNPIPSYRVYIEVDLTFRDKELLPFLSYKIFTPKNITQGKEFTGYAGVLVVHTLLGEYKAFDVACPHETRTDITIAIDEENNAICKSCGSKYEVLLNFGTGGRIDGPSKYPLRPYSILFKDNNTLIVRNN